MRGSSRKILAFIIALSSISFNVTAFNKYWGLAGGILGTIASPCAWFEFDKKSKILDDKLLLLNKIQHTIWKQKFPPNWFATEKAKEYAKEIGHEELLQEIIEDKVLEDILLYAIEEHETSGEAPIISFCSIGEEEECKEKLSLLLKIKNHLWGTLFCNDEWNNPSCQISAEYGGWISSTQALEIATELKKEHALMKIINDKEDERVLEREKFKNKIKKVLTIVAGVVSFFISAKSFKDILFAPLSDEEKLKRKLDELFGDSLDYHNLINGDDDDSDDSDSDDDSDDEEEEYSRRKINEILHFIMKCNTNIANIIDSEKRGREALEALKHNRIEDYKTKITAYRRVANQLGIDLGMLETVPDEEDQKDRCFLENKILLDLLRKRNAEANSSEREQL